MPKLRDIDVEEIALVKSDAQPVNPDARIELVKAEPAADAQTQPAVVPTDDGFVSRLSKAIVRVLRGDDLGTVDETSAAPAAATDAPAAADATAPVQKADSEGGDDGDGDNDADDVDVSDSGTHGAYSGTHTHDHQDGNKGMHSHSHSHDNDGDHGHAHTQKAEEMTLDDVLHEMEHIAAHVEKARAGAAKFNEVRPHADAVSREANDFVRQLRTTIAANVAQPQAQSPAAPAGTTPENTVQKGASPEMDAQQVTDLIKAAIAEALDARDQKLQTTVSELVEKQLQPLSKAVTDLEESAIEKARQTPAAKPATTAEPTMAERIAKGSPAGRLQAETRQKVTGMSYSDALRTLLHNE